MKTRGPARLIAIVGGSGAGKTWLAARLQRALQGQATRLSLDDFYRDRSHLSSRRRERLNFDHPRSIDWPRVERALRQFRAGRTASTPRYDFATHSRLAESRSCPPRPVLLMDGLWLLRRPTVRRLFDLRVFLDCPERLRFRRRLARDQAERGRSEASVRRRFHLTVAPMHHRFVSPQARWADVIFHQTPTDADVAGLAAHVRSLGEAKD